MQSGIRRHETLLDRCAWAATAAEARFRIDDDVTLPRASRVIALDEPAAVLVRRLAGEQWHGGHFLVFEEVLPANGTGGGTDDAVLRAADGSAVLLSDELAGADVAVVVATADVRIEAASVIGDVCAARKVMTAGLVLSGGGGVTAAVAALRPNVMVLLQLSDPDDILPVLSALRV